MKKFYNNIEVEVIAELPNKQVAIKLITGLHHDYDSEYGDMSEPIENTLVVNECELKDSAITKDDIILERELMLKEIQKKKSEMISLTNSEIRKEHLDLQKEIKEMKLERENLLKNSKQVATIRKLQEDKIKYVIQSYHIIPYGEFLVNTKSSYDTEVEWERLVYRIAGNELVLDSYSRVQLFETLEEAKEHLTEVFSKMNITEKLYLGLLDEILKWDLQIPNLTLDLKNAIIKNYNKGILNYIKSYKDNIEKYEKQLRDELCE